VSHGAMVGSVRRSLAFRLTFCFRLQLRSRSEGAGISRSLGGDSRGFDMREMSPADSTLGLDSSLLRLFANDKQDMTPCFELEAWSRGKRVDDYGRRLGGSVARSR
jgi:hypothetical protein